MDAPPLRARPRLAGWELAFLAASLSVGTTLGQLPPEQPDWNQSTPAEAPAAADASVTDSPAPPQAANPPPASDPATPPPQVQRAMDNFAPVQDETTAAVGVPSDTNFFLPDFSDYGRDFFEHEGLRFRVGPVHGSIALGLGTEYIDNVYGSPENPIADEVAKVTPYLLLGVGDYTAKTEDYLSLDYRPSYDYYLSHSDLNRLNQSLDLGGRATFSRYTTALTLSYLNTNVPNATQSNRQNYQVFSATWDNSYYLSGKVFGRLTMTALGQSYETNSDQYTTYSVSPLLGYEYSPKTIVFFGPYAGIAYIGSSDSAGSDGTQNFQGFTLGFNYTNLRKIKLNGTVGVQARQFNGFNASGASNFTTPVFDFNLIYTPREKTDVTIGFARDVQISDILQGLTYTNTEFRLNLVHRLTPHLQFSLGIDYQYLEYQGLAPEGRTDQYLVATPTMSYSFWRDQCVFNVYYRRQQRTSSLAVYEYTINTYGLQFVFRF